MADTNLKHWSLISLCFNNNCIYCYRRKRKGKAFKTTGGDLRVAEWGLTTTGTRRIAEGGMRTEGEKTIADGTTKTTGRATMTTDGITMTTDGITTTTDGTMKKAGEGLTETMATEVGVPEEGAAPLTEVTMEGCVRVPLLNLPPPLAEADWSNCQ